MNFLAHFYLSGEDDELLVGQALGDFLEHGWERRCPERVREGVRLHQKIDAFTDQHELVGRSRRRFRAPYRRYAGVLLDVFFDHYLARRWDEFDPPAPLEEFASGCYAALERNEALLTERLKRALPSMIAHDWLVRYREPEGVDRAMKGISRRLKRENPLGEAAGLLEQLGAGLEQDFVEFFPQLRAFVEGWESEGSGRTAKN